MVVQHNMSAMTANRYYTNNNSALSKSMEKLSSGLAINRAGDNAAGLAVSEKMRAQIGGLTQASKNAQDGISMVQTFEGALQETDSILQRMRTLAVQSANGSYQSDVDRDAIQLEFDQLNQELNEIADTDYNGVIVLNGGRMTDGTEINDTSKQSTLPTINSPTGTGDVKFEYSGATAANPHGRVTSDLTASTPTFTVNDVAFSVTDNSDGTYTVAAPSGAISGATVTVTAGTDDTIDTSADSSTITATVAKDVANADYKNPSWSTTESTTNALSKVIKMVNSDGIEKNYVVKGTTAANGSKFTAISGIYESDASGNILEDEDGNEIEATDITATLDDTNDKIKLSSTISLSVGKDGKVKSGANNLDGTVKMPGGATEDSVSNSNAFTQGARDFTYANSLTLQVGARSKDAVEFTFKYSANGLGELESDMDASARGLGTDQLDLTSQESANFAIDKIDNAINKVSMIRGTFGAIQNRLEHKINNLDTNAENLTAAESRIRDTQMDQEMMKFTSAQILSQASQSMLAQANSLPQGVLQLLG